MDLPLPIECDDEYWTDSSGKPVFTQPPGKPSKIAFFVSYLRLVQILAFALRTVVSDYFPYQAVPSTNVPVLY